MKKKLLFAVAVFLLALALYAPREASAVPAFARQTGMACNTCHYQHFPAINAFGRAFKAGGYTMMGGQSLIEGDLLSLPSALNASLVTKIRYQKTNGNDATSPTNKGELQFPDEAALLIGGRVGEHVGFLLEASLTAADAENNFSSFKIPISYDAMGTTLSVIPFTTDALGASYGFELLNTGAVRNVRIVENRKDVSAQQYIEPSASADRAATGFAFVASRPLYFANYSAWYPEHGSAAVGPFLHYLRLAFTPTYAGWDLGVGAQWWTGTAKSGDDPSNPTIKHADAWAVDAQAQGTVADFPVGVYLTYASAKKSSSTEAHDLNIFNNSTVDDKTAWSLLGEVGVIPNRLAVSAGYRGGKNGNSNNDGKDEDNAALLGIVYNATQNVMLQLNQSWYMGDADNSADGAALTTLMLFAAF